MSTLKIFNPKILLILIILFTSLVIYFSKIVTITPQQTLGTTYFISPTGSDSNDGLSVNTPFLNIQKAIDLAQPGDLISLYAGVYQQDVITKQDGKPNAPITLTGPREAVITGGDSSRVFEIKNSYISLKGFTIDGQHGDGTSPSDYRDKLLYVQGQTPKSGVKGLKITKMTLQNAGGECVRLRYFAQNNELTGNTIRNCGVYDFRFNEGGKNGEGIYIGTAPEQLSDGKNPTDDPDESNNNLIKNNFIDTQGNECVDIKEGSSGNIVENNRCTGQKDSESGGMDARGSGNTFRNNNIFDNIGAGVRLGGDSSKDGTANNVYNNIIRNNKAGGINFQRTPQGKICGNDISETTERSSVGTYGSTFNPTQPCRSKPTDKVINVLQWLGKQ